MSSGGGGGGARGAHPRTDSPQPSLTTFGRGRRLTAAMGSGTGGGVVRKPVSPQRRRSDVEDCALRTGFPEGFLEGDGILRGSPANSGDEYMGTLRSYADAGGGGDGDSLQGGLPHAYSRAADDAEEQEGGDEGSADAEDEDEDEDEEEDEEEHFTPPVPPPPPPGRSVRVVVDDEHRGGQREAYDDDEDEDEHFTPAAPVPQAAERSYGAHHLGVDGGGGGACGSSADDELPPHADESSDDPFNEDALPPPPQMLKEPPKPFVPPPQPQPQPQEVPQQQQQQAEEDERVPHSPPQTDDGMELPSPSQRPAPEPLQAQQQPAQTAYGGGDTADGSPQSPQPCDPFDPAGAVAADAAGGLLDITDIGGGGGGGGAATGGSGGSARTPGGDVPRTFHPVHLQNTPVTTEFLLASGRAADPFELPGYERLEGDDFHSGLKNHPGDITQPLAVSPPRLTMDASRVDMLGKELAGDAAELVGRSGGPALDDLLRQQAGRGAAASCERDDAQGANAGARMTINQKMASLHMSADMIGDGLPSGAPPSTSSSSRQAPAPPRRPARQKRRWVGLTDVDRYKNAAARPAAAEQAALSQLRQAHAEHTDAARVRGEEATTRLTAQRRPAMEAFCIGEPKPSRPRAAEAAAGEGEEAEPELQEAAVSVASPRAKLTEEEERAQDDRDGMKAALEALLARQEKADAQLGEALLKERTAVSSQVDALKAELLCLADLVKKQTDIIAHAGPADEAAAAAPSSSSPPRGDVPSGSLTHRMHDLHDIVTGTSVAVNLINSGRGGVQEGGGKRASVAVEQPLGSFANATAAAQARRVRSASDAASVSSSSVAAPAPVPVATAVQHAHAHPPADFKKFLSPVARNLFSGAPSPTKTLGAPHAAVAAPAPLTPGYVGVVTKHVSQARARSLNSAAGGPFGLGAFVQTGEDDRAHRADSVGASTAAAAAAATRLRTPAAASAFAMPNPRKQKPLEFFYAEDTAQSKWRQRALEM